MTKIHDDRPLICMPDYMESFCCIQGACEDNCCGADWTKHVDRSTYKKLLDLETTERPGLEIGRHILENPTARSDRDYAMIRNRDKGCPFETPDGLCRIHRDLGPSYLPGTCRDYPRHLLGVGRNRLEKAASVSCPEAARKALLRPEGIRIVEVPVSPEQMASEPCIHRLPEAFSRHPLWEIRDFTLQVLRRRDYRLWERLVALGMFFEKASAHYRKGKNRPIRLLMESYTGMMEEPLLKENLAAIPVRETVQMNLLKKLTDENLSFKVVSPVFVECFQSFLAGIEYDREKQTIERIGANYAGAYREHFLPFITTHEHLLENYLVNHAFMNMFPGRHGDLNTYYVQMALCFAMIKMYMIGMAADHGDAFGKTLALRLIYSFSRNVEHNPDYMRQLHDILRKERLTRMAYMAILLKN